jgi:hypothetical protein
MYSGAVQGRNRPCTKKNSFLREVREEGTAHTKKSIYPLRRSLKKKTLKRFSESSFKPKIN